ncbi:hypothetical protein WH47_02593 [Habropoda laboriosa]|uniref:Myb/SANT-like DNA-binding domain-containing protein n=1 Tax=Habropoda laboriosa TaxID=597456 RepID=A0A0L7QWC1_9HYME|nr:PREDICTED: uncharacterized protein LOC108574628 [Habropoda laboriosa]KOC62890.1 hypothetical protein WH47_02593 [Habropoda laboriosa]
MSDSGENVKYKWTPESTSLLVSVWSDKQVQKQLEYTSKPQLIWESVARYMKKKGYNVSGKQCRSRMKQVLVCYREAKRAGTRAGVEQYYELIDRVLKNKRMEGNNIGIDTVDAMINVKSPPKEMKTNKNLQMRHKFQDHVPTLHRTEALSPTWTLGCDNEYPDSPESNETIIAQPCRVFSPTKDVAINTREKLIQIAGKSTQCNILPVEHPLHINYKQNLLSSYNYGEIPFQNTVQNVQNQIIQENMQQNQNLQQNHMYSQQNMLANNFNQQNLQNLNQGITAQPINVPMQINSMAMQNPNLNHIIQQQNQLQQMTHVNNHAVPQEPRKMMLEQNFAGTYKQQYDSLLTHMPAIVNIKQTESQSPDYSPDVSQNLNDAFCQSKNDEKTHSLNETYNRNMQAANPLVMQNSEISVMTNNATYNDDSLLEFSIDSPTPSENNNKSKDVPVNTNNIPHVPLRKKKTQKLEQLVLSAINSQNEVVNKILTAQNDMVTKFINIDRDRQNRLENRLDDLLKVVHASVVTKQTSETDVELPPPPTEPTITSLAPPPRPGAAPPKLDLVPPKPCRVPCTVANSNIELINQNTVTTRPGVVSPVTSPMKKPGTIWSKLGPVSQSPFVKAQQRLGFQPIVTTGIRTQSSAERRITRELEKAMDTETLIYETKKFLNIEKQLEEKIQNAHLEATISKTLHTRRRLFTQREPTAAMILTATFLENECRTSEQLKNCNDILNINDKNLKNIDDHLLSGQGESYERLRQLNVQPAYVHDKPSDTSTPAKLGTIFNNNGKTSATVPKQTIQQLSQLVMNTGRWKDNGVQNGAQNHGHAIQSNAQKYQIDTQNRCPDSYNEALVVEQPISIPKENQTKNDQNHIRDWMLSKYKDPINEQKMTYSSSCNVINQKPNYPIGFTNAAFDTKHLKGKDSNSEVCRPIGYNTVPDRKQSVRFMDEALAELQRMYIETVAKEQEMNDSLPYVIDNGNTLSLQNQQMIERYIHEIVPRKQLKDRDTDSDNDEFLDTTTTMPVIAPRRSSLTSTGTASTETAHSTKFMKPDNCIIS